MRQTIEGLMFANGSVYIQLGGSIYLQTSKACRVYHLIYCQLNGECLWHLIFQNGSHNTWYKNSNEERGTIVSATWIYQETNNHWEER